MIVGDLNADYTKVDIAAYDSLYDLGRIMMAYGKSDIRINFVKRKVYFEGKGFGH